MPGPKWRTASMLPFRITDSGKDNARPLMLQHFHGNAMVLSAQQPYRNRFKGFFKDRFKVNAKFVSCTQPVKVLYKHV